MKNKVVIQASFARPAKLLAKRYRSFTSDLLLLIEMLEENALLGTSIGGNTRKIRMEIKSKGKGKSGGARVISYAYLKGSSVHLLTVYDKSDRDTISDDEIHDMVREIEKELGKR